MTYHQPLRQLEASAPWRRMPAIKSPDFRMIPENKMQGKRYDKGVLASVSQEGLNRRLNGSAAGALEETQFTSSPTEISRSISVGNLVQMGEIAQIYILKRLEKGEVKLVWLVTLRLMSTENPVPLQSIGIVSEMARSWVDWGKAKKLI